MSMPPPQPPPPPAPAAHSAEPPSTVMKLSPFLCPPASLIPPSLRSLSTPDFHSHSHWVQHSSLLPQPSSRSTILPLRLMLSSPHPVLHHSVLHLILLLLLFLWLCNTFLEEHVGDGFESFAKKKKRQ